MVGTMVRVPVSEAPTIMPNARPSPRSAPRSLVGPVLAVLLVATVSACEGGPGAAGPVSLPDADGLAHDASAADLALDGLPEDTLAIEDLGTDPDLTHGDGSPEDAVTADAGPEDVGLPLPSLQRYYALEARESSCRTSFDPSWPCSTWWSSGDELMIAAGGFAWLGARSADRLTLEERGFPAGVVTDCAADGVTGAAGETVRFTCLQNGAACTLAFAPETACEPIPIEILVDPAVDLAQIAGISKYNSCAGHGYGCPLREDCFSSLKTYLVPQPAHAGTDDAIPLYAPCDGAVARIFSETNLLPCYEDLPQGEQLHVVCDAAPELVVKLFHTRPDPELIVGAAIDAGSPLGFADVRECPPHATSFDLTVERFGDAYFVFDYMSDEVVEAWQDWGLAEPWEDAIMTDETRGDCESGAVPPSHWFFPDDA